MRLLFKLVHLEQQSCTLLPSSLCVNTTFCRGITTKRKLEGQQVTSSGLKHVLAVTRFSQDGVPIVFKRLSSHGASQETDQKDSTLVYVGQMSSSVMRLKRFTLVSSAIGLSLQPIIMKKILASSFVAGVGIGAFATFFVFGTPFLIHWVTKRYIIELSFDRDTKTFTAKTPTILCMQKSVHFTANDVRVPEVPGPFTTFLVNNQPMFVEPNSFEDPDVYEHLMGFDKPLDLHLGSETKDKAN